MRYSFRLAARVLLYASSHRQDNTYHGLCYTSCGALAGTKKPLLGWSASLRGRAAGNLKYCLRGNVPILNRKECIGSVLYMSKISFSNAQTHGLLWTTITLMNLLLAQSVQPCLIILHILIFLLLLTLSINNLNNTSTIGYTTLLSMLNLLRSRVSVARLSPWVSAPWNTNIHAHTMASWLHM